MTYTRIALAAALLGMPAASAAAQIARKALPSDSEWHSCPLVTP
jgi:hypothetical protein